MKNYQNEKKGSKRLTFTINRDNHMSKKMKSMLRENQEDINTLLGKTTRLIVAERKIKALHYFFAKSSF